MQHVVCHLVLRDSSAIKFDTVEIAFILALLYGLKPVFDDFDLITIDNKNNRTERHSSGFSRSRHCAANCLQHACSIGHGKIVCYYDEACFVSSRLDHLFAGC